MATQLGDIHLTLSGGATNTDPQASLGGIISTEAAAVLAAQTTGVLSNVTGVTINTAFNNPEGTGTFRYDFASTTIYWRPPSDASEYGVDVSAGNGDYTAGTAASGFVFFTVVAASLPGSNQQDSIAVANNFGNLWDNISSQESLDGSTEYRCIYIHNTGDTTIFTPKIWIKQQPTGPDTLSIALDAAGVGDGSTTGVAAVIIDEEDSTNVLSGLTFTSPSTQGTGLAPAQLDPGECVAYWQKRELASNNDTQALNDTSIVSVSGNF